jgi:hypothetical protein
MMFDCLGIKKIIESFSLIEDCDLLKDGSLRLATPLLYPDGSNIDVFYCQPNETINSLYITDLGQTVAYLADLHIYPYSKSSSKKRLNIIRDICDTLGVLEKNGELIILAPDQCDVAGAILRLAQACVRVADLCYTQKFNSRSNFKEEFENYLCEIVPKSSYETNFKLKGKFNNDVTVDFAISGKCRKSLVLTLSTSSGNVATSHNVTDTAFKRLYDLEEYRKDEKKYKLITVFDSSNNKKIPQSDISRLRDLSEVISYPEQSKDLVEMLDAA